MDVGPARLARLADADAAAIGARTHISVLSAETMAKQRREHPEPTRADHAAAQTAMTDPTHQVQDGPRSLLHVLVDPTQDRGGLGTVVRATRSGHGLFVVSLRRLSRDEAGRERTIRNLLRKGRS